MELANYKENVAKCLVNNYNYSLITANNLLENNKADLPDFLERGYSPELASNLLKNSY